MALAKTLFVMGLGAAAVSFAHTQTVHVAAKCSGGSRGGELLFRALEKSKKVTVEAIVLRPNPMDPKQQMKMRMQQAPNGWMRMTVLAPLSSQGVVSVDDGKEWKTYLPDENRLLIQQSPRAGLSATSRRPRAEMNYRFKVTDGENICGRPTILITANPKSSLMPTRQYSIDRETQFVLRMVSVSEEVEKLLLDTQYANFDVRFDTSDWNSEPLRPTRTIRMTPPKVLENALEAKAAVGFAPALPMELPLGFGITEQHLAGRQGRNFIAVRITDGLASATVYQWNGQAMPDLRFGGTTRPVEAKGVKLQTVGDLPEAVLARITDAFLRELLKGLQALLGTKSDSQTLASTRLEISGEDTVFFIFL